MKNSERLTVDQQQAWVQTLERTPRTQVQIPPPSLSAVSEGIWVLASGSSPEVAITLATARD